MKNVIECYFRITVKRSTNVQSQPNSMFDKTFFTRLGKFSLEVVKSKKLFFIGQVYKWIKLFERLNKRERRFLDIKIRSISDDGIFYWNLSV